MLKIFKYSLFDLVRSRWAIIYTLFYAMVGIMLCFYIGDQSKVLITLMNVVLLLTPLISIVFGIIYYYNSLDFITLLLAQPLKRTSLIFGTYLGAAGSLSMSLLVGAGIPLMLYSAVSPEVLTNVLILLGLGCVLTFIFSAIAFNVAIANDNRIKGFSVAILIWLILAVVYDGLFLLIVSVFRDYPLETPALITMLLNPIDLSRITLLLHMDLSALMGYTGAVFSKFFGSYIGVGVSIVTLAIWLTSLIFLLRRFVIRKDF